MAAPTSSGLASSNSHHRRPWRETPLIESVNLSKAAGCRIFLKLETLQSSGSFKARGLGLRMQRSLQNATDPTRVHFYSSSGGNAGLACVYAANFFGRPSTVVVPMSTRPMMIAKIEAAGATQVIQHGASWRDADTHMREVVMETAQSRGEDPVYMPPFDHPDIWEGHATMMHEIDRDLRDIYATDSPDLVVCSCGGGGLFCGIMQGITDLGSAWKDKTKVLVVNTEGADAFPRCLDADELLTLPGITSIATSLGCTRISERTFALGRHGRKEGKVLNVVLSDAEATMGCWRLADDERLLVEPACGVSVALCYGNRLEQALGRSINFDEKVVIVVCGGQGVSVGLIEEWRREYGNLDVVKGVPNGSSKVPSAVTAL